MEKTREARARVQIRYRNPNLTAEASVAGLRRCRRAGGIDPRTDPRWRSSGVLARGVGVDPTPAHRRRGLRRPEDRRSRCRRRTATHRARIPSWRGRLQRRRARGQAACELDRGSVQVPRIRRRRRRIARPEDALVSGDLDFATNSR